MDDNHQNFLKHSHERQARKSDDNQLRGQKSVNYHSYSLTHYFKEVFYFLPYEGNSGESPQHTHLINDGTDALKWSVSLENIK